MMPFVLDSGALIALERRDLRLVALARRVAGGEIAAYVPSGVVAQCWRGSPRQQPIARLLRSRAVSVDPLTEELSYRVGVLLGRSGTSDVVDGHVALLAGRLRATVLTTDPNDLAALDASLDLVIL